MSKIEKDLGASSAYAYAVQYGEYTGTEEEYGQEMADLANISAEAETLSPDEEASASYSGGLLSFGIPQGVTGNGIASAVLNSDFTLTLTFTDGTTYTTPTPIKGETGAKGDTGATGATGNGIASIAKTGTVELVDTYTITFTDGTTTTFNVTNGAPSPFTNEFRSAILALALNVAYATDDGMTVYNSLLNALYAEWEITNNLSHCTTSNTDTTIPKNAEYSATITVDSGYMLTGGTISIIMGGVDITSTAYNNGEINIPYVTGNLSITITAVEDPTQNPVLDGLVAWWDGFDNTSSGHSSAATTWEAKRGDYELTENGSGCSWNNDSLQCSGATDGSGYYGDTLWEYSSNATIEIVLAPSATSTMVVGTFDRDASPLSAGGTSYNVRRFAVFSDNTVNFVGRNSKSYANTESALSSIKKLVCAYNGFFVSKAFINGTKLPATPDGNTHSFTFTGDPQIRIGVENFFEGSPTTKYPFNGKIYAIRVYNRVLTDEEIARNLAFDNNRYSLGLTL